MAFEFDIDYIAEEKGHITAYIAVVHDLTREQGCKVSELENESNFIGITVHSQAPGGRIAVRKGGIAWAKAACAIEIGEPLVLAPDGLVMPAVCIHEPRLNCIGFANTGANEKNGRLQVWISPHQRVS